MTIPDAWMIDGQLRAGSVAALVDRVAVGLYRPAQTDDAMLFSIDAETALRPGAAAIGVERSTDGPSLRVRIANAGSSQGVAVVVKRAPSRREAPDIVAPLPVLKPADLPVYRGGQPGLAAVFEIRPLPPAMSTIAVSQAWVRRHRDTGPFAAALLAIDAWITPAEQDQLRRYLCGDRVDRLNGGQLVGASIAFTGRGRQSTGGWWFLRTERGEADGDLHGSLVDDVGRLLVRFDVRSDLGIGPS